MNSVSNTVRGVNIAALILSIVSLVFTVICVFCAGWLEDWAKSNVADWADEVTATVANEAANNAAASSAANTSSNVSADGATNASSAHHTESDIDADADEVLESAGVLSSLRQQKALWEIDLNGEKINVAALAAALSSVDDADLTNFATMLTYFSQGDYASALNLASTWDIDDLRHGFYKLADLSDNQLERMAAASGNITVAQLSALRLDAQLISDDDLSLLGRYIGAQGTENILNDVIRVVFMFSYAILLILFLVNVVALITSILAIRNARKPRNLTAAFVMSIISAVLMGLTFSIVRLVLYIVSAVSIYKVRKGSKTIPGSISGSGSMPYGAPGGASATGSAVSSAPAELPRAFR